MLSLQVIKRTPLQVLFCCAKSFAKRCYAIGFGHMKNQIHGKPEQLIILRTDRVASFRKDLGSLKPSKRLFFLYLVD